MSTSNAISMTRALVVACMLGVGMPVAAMEPAPSADLREQLIKHAKRGNVVLVQQLLGKGAYINTTDDKGMTLLHLAAAFGRLEVVRFLLQQPGININATANNRCTPLHYAAKNGHEAVVGFLLQRGAAVNAVGSWNRTPLHWSTERSYKEVVGLLLQQPETNINATDVVGNTPLHFASKGEVVGLLLQHGIHVNAINIMGQTSLDWALDVGNTGVIGLLQQHGAVTGQQIQAQQPAGVLHTQQISQATAQPIQAVKAYSKKIIIYLAHNCAICQDGQGDTDREGVVILPCGHAFHEACLQGWFDANKNTCPECRQVIGS